jgi:hypothetical protein
MAVRQLDEAIKLSEANAVADDSSISGRKHKSQDRTPRTFDPRGVYLKILDIQIDPELQTVRLHIDPFSSRREGKPFPSVPPIKSGVFRFCCTNNSLELYSPERFGNFLIPEAGLLHGTFLHAPPLADEEQISDFPSIDELGILQQLDERGSCQLRFPQYGLEHSAKLNPELHTRSSVVLIIKQGGSYIGVYSFISTEFHEI